MKGFLYGINDSILSIRKTGICLILLCLLSVILSGCVSPRINLFSFGTDPLREYTLEGKGEGKVLVISVKGIIWDVRRDDFFRTGPSMLQEIVAQLKKAEKDEDIKAVLLKIDSPGGTVTASDIIYNEIQKFKEKTGAKIVVSMMDIAASGGYYISLPADYIIAHPTTITGSVGVMFPRWQAFGLMEKIGVRRDVSKSGKLKDMGSPFREPTQEEEKLFQGLTDGLNDRFLTLVKKHRNLESKNLEEVATAKVFLAQEALDKGLIDKVGYLNEAVDKAKTMAGLQKDAKIIVYRRTEQPDDNLYNTSTGQYSDKQKALVNLDLLEGLSPNLKGGFYYIWAPGISD